MKFFSNDYTKTLMKRDDGSFYNLIEVKIDKSEKIEFHQITTEETQSKILNIGQLRMLKARERGVTKPVVIIWDAFLNSRRAEEFFSIDNLSKETIHLSLNSFITFYLRYIIDSKNYLIVDKKIRVKKIECTKDEIVKNIIELLENENRIRVFMQQEDTPMEYIYENLDSRKDCVAVGNIGFPSTYCRKNEYPLIFNTSFFLLEVEDYISEFSLLGDSYGMMINKGVIEIPPIYNRYALLLDDNDKWEMNKVSLRNMSLKCFGKTFNLSEFAFNKKSSHAIYTRYFGVVDKGRTINYSPLNEENVDFVIIGRDIVGMKYCGEIEIPQNGFVISIPIKEFRKLKFENNMVSYEFLDNHSYKEGIQCGPGIIKDGNIILNKNSLVGEEFYKKHLRDDGSYDFGVVPTDYAEDIDESRHARIMLCIDKDDNLGLLAAESVNKGMGINGQDPAGASLLEMAELAKEKEYKFVLNLDGGGSTNIQYLYGQLVRNADRRGLPGVLYERMIPCVGVIIE